MSGTVCLIIIRGNMLQALMRSTIERWGGDYPDAQVAIGNAQSLCQLGTFTYDGVEVMTDAQQLRATDMMRDLNDVVLPIIEAGGFSPHDRRVIHQAIVKFIDLAEALLAEVSSV